MKTIDIDQVRTLASGGMSARAISRETGISHTYVSTLLRSNPPTPVHASVISHGSEVVITTDQPEVVAEAVKRLLERLTSC